MYLFRKIAPFLSLLWPDLHPELLPRVCLIIWYYVYSLSTYSLQTISHCWPSFGNLHCLPSASVTLTLPSFSPSLRHQFGVFCCLLFFALHFLSPQPRLYFLFLLHSLSTHFDVSHWSYLPMRRIAVNAQILSYSEPAVVPTVSRIIAWTLTEQEMHEPWQMEASNPREGRKGKSEGAAYANAKNLKARWCPWEMVASPAPSSQGWRLQEWPR